MANYAEYADEPMLDDPEVQRLVADLRVVYRSVTPAEPRARIGNLLQKAAQPETRPLTNRLARCAAWAISYPSRFPGVRPASLMTALVLVVVSALGYTRLQAPTAVSAAQILHRAAAAMAPTAGDVIHEQTSYAYHPVITPPAEPAPAYGQITAEQWTGLADDGSVDQLALTVSVNGVVRERQVINGQTSWAYNKSQNTVYISQAEKIRLAIPEDPAMWPKAILFQPEDPAALRDMVLHASQAPNTELLPKETLNGRAVDVVRVTYREPDVVNGSPVKLPAYAPKTETFTFYIDASTYLVQRLDELDVNAGGATVGTATIAVSTHETMPASQVPAGTFTFTSPPGARIVHCTAPENHPACG